MILQSTQNELIWGIPPIIFSGVMSGIIGAFIALLGTYLQNKAHANRQKESLEHEANQRKLEREMVMRREIYLEGAEALGRMENYLFTFTDLTNTNEQRQNVMKDANEAINKIALIANNETLTRLDELQQHFSASVRTLVENRTYLDLIVEEQQLRQKDIVYLQEEWNQKQKIIIGLNPQKDYSLIQATINEQNSLRKQLIEIQKNFLEEQKVIQQKNAVIFNIAIQGHCGFQILAAKVNVWARREIDIPLDADKYLKLIENSTEKSKKEVTEWFENYNRNLREKWDNIFDNQN